MELQQSQQPRTALINELPQTRLSSRTLLRFAGKIYRGVRQATGNCDVSVETTVDANSTPDTGTNTTSTPLPLHLELRNHSPAGFAWGYAGSGPAQLALAILLDATGSPTLALRH